MRVTSIFTRLGELRSTRCILLTKHLVQYLQLDVKFDVSKIRDDGRSRLYRLIIDLRKYDGPFQTNCLFSTSPFKYFIYHRDGSIDAESFKQAFKTCVIYAQGSQDLF